MAEEGNLNKFKSSDNANKKILAGTITEKLRSHGMAERIADSVIDKVSDDLRR
jgi:hypothetical protein